MLSDTMTDWILRGMCLAVGFGLTWVAIAILVAVAWRAVTIMVAS